MRSHERMRYCQPFPVVIPLIRAGSPRVTHPSATRLKRSLTNLRSKYLVRLACVRHAASVHPEPGSNSLKKFSPGTRSLSFLSYPVPNFVVLRIASLFWNLSGRFRISRFWLHLICVSLFSYQCAPVSPLFFSGKTSCPNGQLLYTTTLYSALSTTNS